MRNETKAKSDQIKFDISPNHNFVVCQGKVGAYIKPKVLIKMLKAENSDRITWSETSNGSLLLSCNIDNNEGSSVTTPIGFLNSSSWGEDEIEVSDLDDIREELYDMPRSPITADNIISFFDDISKNDIFS